MWSNLAGKIKDKNINEDDKDSIQNSNFILQKLKSETKKLVNEGIKRTLTEKKK